MLVDFYLATNSKLSYSLQLQALDTLGDCFFKAELGDSYQTEMLTGLLQLSNK